MKWFKHLSTAYTDLALQELRADFGLEGYGFYWLCIEIVAQQGQKNRIKNTKSWKKALRSASNLSEEKIEKLLKSMAELNLINANALKDGDLWIPKLRKYGDEYYDRLGRLSRQGRDFVVLDKNRLDKITTHYIQLKGWKIENNKDLLNDIYKRNVRPAKKLFNLLKNEAEVLKAMQWVAQTCQNKGLQWTLETVIKWYPDFLKYKRPEIQLKPQETKPQTVNPEEHAKVSKLIRETMEKMKEK